MKLTGDFIHRLAHPCAIPGSMFWWPDNECRIDWDAAAELAAVSGLVMTLGSD